MQEWENKEDFKEFMEIRSNIRKLRDGNTADQIKMAENYQKDMKSLEKQRDALMEKNGKILT